MALGQHDLGVGRIDHATPGKVFQFELLRAGTIIAQSPDVLLILDVDPVAKPDARRMRERAA